jgi:hypothetical protein
VLPCYLRWYRYKLDSASSTSSETYPPFNIQAIRSLHSLIISSKMPYGVRYSDDLRHVLVRMKALNLTIREISHLTGVPERSIRNIILTYNKTGKVECKQNKRQYKVSEDDAKVNRLYIMLICSDNYRLFCVLFRRTLTVSYGICNSIYSMRGT